ncbi:MAG: hypothetical protein IK115_02240 [Lachnospiraceae bacterium]|nr:hypothetical protein [Lachnospiraceae bacterium]
MIKKIKNTIKKGLRMRPEDIVILSEIMMNLTATAQLHHETFLPFKNYCKGEKDVVVCAAGPSLNDYNPIQDAVHIAVNRSFLFDKVKFDFIFAQDFDGVRMVQEQLIEYDCVKFLGTQGVESKKIPESLIIKSGARKFDTDWYIPGAGLGGKMAVDLENRPLCNMINVGQSVMQLALYLNPKRIYIVGCDLSGNHFATGNQTKEEAEQQGEQMEIEWKRDHDLIINRWIEVKEFAKTYYPDTEIISVNPIGLKGLFKDLYQDK